jgi:predicted esterase
MDDLGFHHRFVKGDPLADGVTLLLLHGTGGDESDLIPLGQALAPGAALLSPRGRVLENAMPRFFRRLAEGVFDQKDLGIQTEDLAHFIKGACRTYDLRADRIVAVGYSNGANIASSVLLTHPGLLAAAVLFRPMVPFVPSEMPDLKTLKVFIAAGHRDTIASRQETERLVEIFRGGGAAITTFWHNGGHELGEDDLNAAKEWVSQWLLME